MYYINIQIILESVFLINQIAEPSIINRFNEKLQSGRKFLQSFVIK